MLLLDKHLIGGPMSLMQGCLCFLLLHLLLGHGLLRSRYAEDAGIVFAIVQLLPVARAELHKRFIVGFLQHGIELLRLAERDVCVHTRCAHDVILAQVFPLCTVVLVIVSLTEVDPVRRRVQILVSLAAFARACCIVHGVAAVDLGRRTLRSSITMTLLILRCPLWKDELG